MWLSFFLNQTFGLVRSVWLGVFWGKSMMSHNYTTSLWKPVFLFISCVILVKPCHHCALISSFTKGILSISPPRLVRTKWNSYLQLLSACLLLWTRFEDSVWRASSRDSELLTMWAASAQTTSGQCLRLWGWWDATLEFCWFVMRRWNFVAIWDELIEVNIIVWNIWEPLSSIIL